MKLILSTLIFILSFSKASYASEDVLEDANLYTVKFRTSVDRPFREDKNAGLRKGSGQFTFMNAIN